MADLIPHNELKIISREDSGWIVYAYRGATIRANGVHAALTMPGHPYDGTRAGNVELYQRFIDYWLDHQALPPGYRIQGG